SAPAVIDHAPFVTGRAEVVSHGKSVAILTYGPLLAEAVQVSDRLGMGVRLVNVRTLHPIDEEAVLEAARETGLLVTLEDHFLTGGLATIVAEVLVRHGMSRRLLPLALEERWFAPARLSDVLAHEGFTADRIAERIVEALGSVV